MTYEITIVSLKNSMGTRPRRVIAGKNKVAQKADLGSSSVPAVVA